MAEKIDSKSDGEVDRPAHLSDDSESGDVIDEKRLLRKIDARLLPAVGILYLLSFLDRSNGMADMFGPQLTKTTDNVCHSRQRPHRGIAYRYSCQYV